MYTFSKENVLWVMLKNEVRFKKAYIHAVSGNNFKKTVIYGIIYIIYTKYFSGEIIFLF